MIFAKNPAVLTLPLSPGADSLRAPVRIDVVELSSSDLVEDGSLSLGAGIGLADPPTLTFRASVDDGDRPTLSLTRSPFSFAPAHRRRKAKKARRDRIDAPLHATAGQDVVTLPIPMKAWSPDVTLGGDPTAPFVRPPSPSPAADTAESTGALAAITVAVRPRDTSTERSRTMWFAAAALGGLLVVAASLGLDSTSPSRAPRAAAPAPATAVESLSPLNRREAPPAAVFGSEPAPAPVPPKAVVRFGETDGVSIDSPASRPAARSTRTPTSKPGKSAPRGASPVPLKVKGKPLTPEQELAEAQLRAAAR